MKQVNFVSSKLTRLFVNLGGKLNICHRYTLNNYLNRTNFLFVIILFSTKAFFNAVYFLKFKNFFKSRKLLCYRNRITIS